VPPQDVIHHSLPPRPSSGTWLVLKGKAWTVSMLATIRQRDFMVCLVLLKHYSDFAAYIQYSSNVEMCTFIIVRIFIRIYVCFSEIAPN
jgi:hypothetical protein